jgi:hypothetical protein
VAGAEPSELGNAEIALLCDVESMTREPDNPAKAALLRRLIADGFIEPADAPKAPMKYQLTAKAHKVLTERGVGLNEA